MCIEFPLPQLSISSDGSFENALLMPEADPILSKILQQFVLNMRPQTRNLRYVCFCSSCRPWRTFRGSASVDQISSTLSSVLADTFKTSERTVFWDDECGANVDPFANLEGGFFAADWALKVGLLS